MRNLALEHERSGAAFPPDLLRAEARRLWELQQQGIVREVCFRADRHEAVLMLECADDAEARSHLETLPLVQAGLIDFEVIPLIPYDGFARLFAR